MSAQTAEKESTVVREINDYPPILQACHIMEITGFSNGKAYELMRSKGCPTVRHGKRMIVPRDLFWQYLLNEAARNTVFEGAVTV